MCEPRDFVRAALRLHATRVHVVPPFHVLCEYPGTQASCFEVFGGKKLNPPPSSFALPLAFLSLPLSLHPPASRFPQARGRGCAWSREETGPRGVPAELRRLHVHRPGESIRAARQRGAGEVGCIGVWFRNFWTTVLERKRQIRSEINPCPCSCG